jgi:hypothetical protein
MRRSFVLAPWLALLGAALVAGASPTRVAHAGSGTGATNAAGAGPLRLAIECQDSGRTKACPSFLLGFVEASPLLLSSPRANAQVVLYVTAVAIANDDRLHLRFVGDVKGAPGSIEVDVELDTRATDDDQRAQLEPAFLRGLALYVASFHPEAVKIVFEAAAGATGARPATTPWGVSVDMNGSGSWSGPYKSASGFAGVELSRVEPRSRWRASAGASGGLDRQPAVSGVSFNATRWNLSAGASTNQHLSDCWSYEVATSTWRDDPKGQFRFGWAGSLAIERDFYPSDDPRGNLLAVAYGVGYRVEGYNFRNELGERFAHFPEHRLGAAASLRKDKISYSLNLLVNAELVHPSRRYTLTGSPGLEIQLGAHVDLGLELSVTKRELPELLIPEDDPEAIGRAEYAQSLSMSAFANLRLHWDATNGVRNNRFTRL